MAGESESDLGIAGIGEAVLVGRGGFGAVYRAQQSDFRRTVAVKVLSAPETDEIARSRFSRECQAMGSLSGHPNIVTLYDAGFLPDGRAYLVMGYMEGGSLHEIAYGADQLTWQEVATIGTKLAGALETAHRAGILHRDLKPANVLISSYGEPQLTDFGIARIAGGHETTSSHITASLPYAPPEVLDGRAPSAASDVYGLAATLLHLITGRAPFTHTDDTSFAPLLRRVYEEDIPDLTAYGVPAAFDLVLRRAMSKDASQRPATAEELGRQIQAAQRSLGLPAGEMVIAGAPRQVPVGDDLPTAPPVPSGDPGGGAAAWWGATAPEGAAPPPVTTPAPPARFATPAPPYPTPGPPVTTPTPPVTGASQATLYGQQPPAGPTPGAPPYLTPSPYGTGPTPTGAGAPGSGGSRRTGMIVGGSVAAAAALVVGIIAFSGGGGSGGDDPETQTAVSAPTATAEPEDPTTTDQGTAVDEPTATPAPIPTPETATPTPAAPPPTPAPAGDLALGGSVSGTLTTGQIAAHTFTGAALQVVQIVANSPNADPFITLRAADGTRLGLDDDCATQAATTDSQLLTTLPADGIYTVEVEFIGAGGDYTLSTTADASPRRGSTPFAQIFGTPTAGRFQEVWVIATSDTSLTIQDGSGRIVANDDDCFADLDPRIESFSADPNGSIIVESFGLTPTTTQIGVFGFDNFTAAGLIESGTSTAFVVDLLAGQTIAALMTSGNGDSYLSVQDLDGNEVAFDDDSGGGLDAQVSFVAPADGRFQVVSTFLGTGTGAFDFAATIG